MHNDIDEILITQEQIQARVRELGREISGAYAGQELTLVAVLRGAIVFLADLCRNIHLPVQVDFMVVEKIRDGDGQAAVKIIKDLDKNIEGKHVLVIEDIIDEGRTLAYLLENLKLREPASLKVVTIFDKPHQRATTIEADYVGFGIPDRFVVGYGLDFKQGYRHLGCLGVLKEAVATG